MKYRTLGSTGVRVSQVAFGAGPVAEVMLGNDFKQQQDLVNHAIKAGINWFDTAAGYGDGLAETHLGAAIRGAGAAQDLHVATKVRLKPVDLSDIVGNVRRSVHASLERLDIPKITLLQLHNAVTRERRDEPDSITVDDVLGREGVLTALEQLRTEGIVTWFGITGIGQPDALEKIIRCGAFHSIQVPYNLVNPSAGQAVPEDFQEANYGNIIATASQCQLGIFAIRVYAGGALAGNPPSQHALRTKYFPIDLYERDQQRIEKLRRLLPKSTDLKKLALRFAVDHQAVTSAIVGFSETPQIDEAVSYLDNEELEQSLLEIAHDFIYHRV